MLRRQQENAHRQV